MDGASVPGDVPQEKGTMNSDGSVNLGFRKHDLPPMVAESRTPSYTRKPPSPVSAASDLAAYHQQSLRPRNAPQYFNDNNRLPPITSMQTVGAAVDRQSSHSPASFLSPARKRSFSSAENEPRGSEEGGNDNHKRLSSIKSILNPSLHDEARHDDRNSYSLPPLRSPGTTTTAASAPSPSIYSTRDHTPTLSDARGDGDHAKLERRAALQKEAEKMREMLAAKEQELMAMEE